LERNQIIAIVLVVVIVAGVGAYLYLSPPPARPSTLIYETIGNPEYLDPAVDYESFGSFISFNVYETLYTYEWDSANTDPVVPLLATGYTVTADGLNYTFTLRQGVTFHDGTPFNASCVKYSFERALAIFDTFGPAWMIAEPMLGGQAVEDAAYEFGPGSTEHTAAYNTWKAANDAGTGAITVLGTYSIMIRLAYAYTPFLAAMTYEVGAIVSPSYVEAHGSVVIGAHNTWMDSHTCGTGPYNMSDWQPDVQIVLDLYPNYWRAAASKSQFPHSGNVAQVVIKTNEDVNSRILNLKSNTTDIAYWPVSHATEIWNNVTGPNGDGTLKSSIPYLKLWCQEPTFDVMFLGFNMNPLLNRSGVITQSPFVNKDLRVAFSYAFDYDAFIDNVLNGFGQQAQGPIPIGMTGHDSELAMYEYDLDLAVDAWNDAMAAGLNDVWENMSYTLQIYYNSGNTNRERACLLMKDGIQAIIDDPSATQPAQPLTIDVVALEWASYLYQVQHRQLPIFFLGWAPDYADPDNYVGPFVKSTGTYPLRIGLDGSPGWNATEVDGWIAAAAQEQDPTARNALYLLIQEAIVDHVAYIWAYQAQSFHVENIHSFGYVYNPMHDMYFFHYYKDWAVAGLTAPP
jgi:peptide/nickel transport system substrate-binding protein